MRYLGLVTDYDGTLAEGGKVAEEAWEAVRRVRESGRKVILVTGRDLEDVRSICPPAEGLLIPERSFYFRGPEGKLNLRAHNLILFLELADGVDDETWLYHLHQGDYSRWFRDTIGDKELAAEAEEVEARTDRSAADSRGRVRAAVARRYTLPENPSLPRLRPPVAEAVK